MDKNLYLGKRFKFPENNEISWGQDFFEYLGNIPHNVEFEITDFLVDEQVILRGYGYGIKGKDKESYGNGAICVEIKDIIPYVVIE